MNLDEIRAEWEAQNEAHLAAHGAWRCCSACKLADARIPALLAEIDRLNRAWLSARAGERLALAKLAELGGGS